MLIVSDIHLDQYRQFSTINKDGLNTRLMDQLGVIGAVGRLIEDRQEKNVIFLGDMFNSLSDSLPKIIYNAAFALCSTWSRNSELFLIVGNHDIHRGFHLFSAFKPLPNVHVISNPAQFMIENVLIDMIPWGRNVPDVKGDILMGHIAVRGTKVNALGTVIDEGVSPLDLRGYREIFLGHYHDRQPIPVPGAERAEYIGAVIQIDRGNSPEPRGVISLRRGDYEFIPIPSPAIRTVRIKDQVDADDIVRLINRANDYWHITVTSPNVKLPQFDHRVQVEYDITTVHETRLEEKEGEDLVETVKRFIAETNTHVNKERAMELLDEVMK